MPFDLTKTKQFLLDMDGTFYLGDTLLPGALAFWELCQERGIGCAFLTNNSSRGADAYLRRLRGMGVSHLRAEHIFTSADATLLYLSEHHIGPSLLLIGTPSLEAQFTAAGYMLDSGAPKAVVLGFDTTLTYEKLTALCQAVAAGLPYIATHPDLVCPVKGGVIPDIGATIAYVEAVTGRRPDAVVGKPNAYIAQAAARRYGCAVEELCMVGDRLYTDIALGVCGCGTVLVLSGESRREDLPGAAHQPDLVCADLAELCGKLGVRN